MQHRRFTVVLLLLLFCFLSCALSVAQTTTYHPHKEVSSIHGSFDKLLAIGPDAVAHSGSIASKSAEEYIPKEFETQSGLNINESNPSISLTVVSERK